MREEFERMLREVYGSDITAEMRWQFERVWASSATVLFTRIKEICEAGGDGRTQLLGLHHELCEWMEQLANESEATETKPDTTT